MSIQGITGGLPTPARPGSIDLVIPGAGGFADSLTVGQIIKGRVLRHFGGDKYLVDFSGRQHVVDSAIPFNNNDLIHGRVLGLGDQVQLQRVALERGSTGQEPAQAQAPDVQPQTRLNAPSVRNEQLASILARFNTTLSTEDQRVVAAAAREASQPALMTRIAVALNRLGLDQSPALLRAIYSAATTSGQLWSPRLEGGMVPQLEHVKETSPQQLTEALSAFGAVLQQMLDYFSALNLEPPHSPVPDDTEASAETIALHAEPQAEFERSHDGDLASQRQLGKLAHRALNAQSGGVVSHRVSTVPLILGNQLIEVDIAVFDQRHDATAASVTRHRQVVLSLSTPNLGQIELSVGIAGNRLRLRVKTESETSTDALAAHLGALQSDLHANGWEVDQLSYETTQQSSPNVAVRSVIDHLIAQDSLSRLM